MRLEGARAAQAGKITDEQFNQSMLAHSCRCTGWQTIREATRIVVNEGSAGSPVGRDLAAAEQRALLEGGSPQRVHPDVALGRGGFADDTAPSGALIAVRSADGEWVVGETLTEARRAAGKVQGRRTTEPLTWPVDLAEGDWVRTLQTSWVEPAYLEPDASWCEPGGEPMTVLGNGGAFGSKTGDELSVAARGLADRHGRAVRVLASREDVVRRGAKRPPMAIGLRANGSGVVHVVRTAGIAHAIARYAPHLEIHEVDVDGPPTSSRVRGAGWTEVAVALSSLAERDEVQSPSGGWARAEILEDGTVQVSVRAGRVLDPIVLRSYCIGAAHMALGWVRSEGITVDRAGEPHDLTIRSFGVLRAVDTPHIEVTILEDDADPVNGSDAVFAAVAAAAWRRNDFGPRWPANRSE
jgi:hypothetical protein